MGKPNGFNHPLSGRLNTQVPEARPAEVKHLSKRRKINQKRFPQQRRAKREQPKPENLFSGVAGLIITFVETQQKSLESDATQGDRPVCEKKKQTDQYLSRAGHVKPGLNQGGPPSKAKYQSITDSKPVLRRKGEKNLCQRSEIEPETSSLQTVGGLCPFQGNG